MLNYFLSQWDGAYNIRTKNHPKSGVILCKESNKIVQNRHSYVLFVCTINNFMHKNDAKSRGGSVCGKNGSGGIN